ncbi:MAG: nucleotidyltransferase domain-containing protein [Candidatus Altiarchaeota archaeon]|nr:nucleotidyltransferase domain-containing protein [Candidatus Altiarchaeota archaeon]
MDRLSLAKSFAGRIKRKYPGIRKIVCFGSVVRGEDKEDPDIDLLIVSRGDRFKMRHRIMRDVVDTLLKTGVYVSVKTLSEKEYGKLKDTFFISEIEKAGVVIG